MRTVESLDGVIENVTAFNRIDASSSSYALKRFSQFSDWYYISSLGLFGPNKFIGYRDMTLADYRGDGYGGVTKEALKQWFVQLSTSSDEYLSLKQQLIEYGKTLGKNISQKTFTTGGIWVLPSDENAASSPLPGEYSTHTEGATVTVNVNRFERNPKARQQCIDHYGARCYVCGFNFSEKYGRELGDGFIHVHHLVDISLIGEEYEVDPMADLRPLCPNCHAMVHRKRPAMHPDDLKKIVSELNTD